MSETLTKEQIDFLRGRIRFSCGMNEICVQIDHADALALCDLALKGLESERGEWQPIETAPKDGSKILLLNRHWKGFAKVVYWRNYFDGSKGWSMESGDEVSGDWWMPLLEPPKEKL